jgi:uncharacterized repeat protein (TIGR01451 family)
LQADFSASYKQVSKNNPSTNETITYTIGVRNDGKSITDTIYVTDSLPSGLTLDGTSCSPTVQCAGNVFTWQGALTETNALTLTFRVTVTEAASRAITNTVTINTGSAGMFTRSALIIVNGYSVYLPIVRRN